MALYPKRHIYYISESTPRQASAYFFQKHLRGHEVVRAAVDQQHGALAALELCAAVAVAQRGIERKQAADGVGKVQKRPRQVVKRTQLVEKFVLQGDVGAVGDDAPDVLRQGLPGGVEHRGPAHGHAEEGDSGMVVAPVQLRDPVHNVQALRPAHADAAALAFAVGAGVDQQQRRARFVEVPGIVGGGGRVGAVAVADDHKIPVVPLGQQVCVQAQAVPGREIHVLLRSLPQPVPIHAEGFGAGVGLLTALCGRAALPLPSQRKEIEKAARQQKQQGKQENQDPHCVSFSRSFS